MVADHVALFAGSDAVRLTVGRVALPLFVLLLGHLAVRVTSRLLLLVPYGLVVGAAAPWSGASTLFVQLALVGLVVVLVKRRPALTAVLWALLLLALMRSANGFHDPDLGYDTWALLGLGAAGALIPRLVLTSAGRRLPLPFEVVGRYPLTAYAGHVGVLTLLGA